MPTTVKTGWLHDKNGDKFAPKTLTSQVQTSDGTLLEDKIQADIDAAKEDILSNVSIDVDDTLSSTSTNPVQNKVIDAEFDAVSDAMEVLKSAIDGKANSSHTHDDRYYTETEINTELAKKSDTGHIHEITDVTNLQSTLNAKVPTTRTVNGKALSSNITLSASDVGADASGSASSALSSAKIYTDEQVATKTLVQIITWEDDD